MPTYWHWYKLWYLYDIKRISFQTTHFLSTFKLFWLSYLFILNTGRELIQEDVAKRYFGWRNDSNIYISSKQTSWILSYERGTQYTAIFRLLCGQRWPMQLIGDTKYATALNFTEYTFNDLCQVGQFEYFKPAG